MSLHLPRFSGETEVRGGEVVHLRPPRRGLIDHVCTSSNWTLCCCMESTRNQPINPIGRSVSLSVSLSSFPQSVFPPLSPLMLPYLHESLLKMPPVHLQSIFGSVLTSKGKNFFHVQPKYQAASVRPSFRSIKGINIMFPKRSNQRVRDLLFFLKNLILS